MYLRVGVPVKEGAKRWAGVYTYSMWSGESIYCTVSIRSKTQKEDTDCISFLYVQYTFFPSSPVGTLPDPPSVERCCLL
jgi:hypothetical protein